MRSRRSPTATAASLYSVLTTVRGISWASALDRLDAAEQYLTEIVHDSIKPPIYPLIERLELPDSEGVPRPVLRVEVSPSLFVHESPGGFLHRVGSAKRRMEPDFLVRLHQQRSQSRLIRFDEQPLHDASFADLDGALIDRFAVDGMRDDRETLACKLGMAARSGARGLLPTVTGILLGTTEPVERLPHAYVQAVAYRGRSVPESLESPWYQLDAGDIAGPVDRQIAVRLSVRRSQPEGALPNRMTVEDLSTYRQYDMPQRDPRGEPCNARCPLPTGTMPGTGTRIEEAPCIRTAAATVLAGSASGSHDSG